MNKLELREFLEKKAAEYASRNPIYTHAESFDQEKRLKAKIETRKKPANLTQDGYVVYLNELKVGTHKTEVKPSEDLWDVEMPRYEVRYKERGSTVIKRWRCYAQDADEAIEDFKHLYKKTSVVKAWIIEAIKISE